MVLNVEYLRTYVDAGMVEFYACGKVCNMSWSSFITLSIIIVVIIIIIVVFHHQVVATLDALWKHNATSMSPLYSLVTAASGDHHHDHHHDHCLTLFSHASWIDAEILYLPYPLIGPHSSVRHAITATLSHRSTHHCIYPCNPLIRRCVLHNWPDPCVLSQPRSMYPKTNAKDTVTNITSADHIYPHHPSCTLTYVPSHPPLLSYNCTRMIVVNSLLDQRLSVGHGSYHLYATLIISNDSLSVRKTHKFKLISVNLCVAKLLSKR